MATAIVPPPTTAAVRVKWLPLLLAIAIGLAIYFMPAQHGLTRAGQTALAITAFTIVLWAFGVMNNGVASVLMMALLIPAGAKPALALQATKKLMRDQQRMLSAIESEGHEFAQRLRSTEAQAAFKAFMTRRGPGA